MDWANIKVGLKVHITKPLDINEGPTWGSDMDHLDGMDVTIARLSHYRRWFHIENDPFGFAFDARWATPVVVGSPSVSTIVMTKDEVKKFLIATMSQKSPKVNTDCPCSTRDLMTIGHKCGRKARIDTWR